MWKSRLEPRVRCFVLFKALFPLPPHVNTHHLVLCRVYNSLFLHPSRCPWILTPPWTPTPRWSGSPACRPATGRCWPTSRSWSCPPTPNGSFLEHGKNKHTSSDLHPSLLSKRLSERKHGVQWNIFITLPGNMFQSWQILSCCPCNVMCCENMRAVNTSRSPWRLPPRLLYLAIKSFTSVKRK